MTLTHGGILLALIGPIILHYLGTWGVSQACSNELIQFLPVIGGGLISWFDQWKSGHASLFGAKIG